MKKNLLLTLFAGLATTLSATTFTITTTDTSIMLYTQEGSLAHALYNAKDGDVVEFNFEGTTITQPDDRTSLSVSVTIDGLNKYNNEPVIFNGTSGLFYTGAGTDITLKNLVLNGSQDEIGITCGGDKLTIENCSFINCNSNDVATNNGGAIRNGSGDLIVTNCYFENCKSGGGYGGGAICSYKADKTTTITNSTFTNCTAIAGGAIQIQGGHDLAVSNSTFANNAANMGTSDRRGGAIYLKGTAGTVDATIVNSTFTGNKALNNGGGVCCYAGSGYYINMTLVNNIFLHNYTTSSSDVHAWNLNARVFTETSNCFYGSDTTTGSIFDDTTSTQYDVSTDLGIFAAFEASTLGLDVEVPVLDSEANVVKLAENSPAIGAGVATYEGVEIPTTDQLGAERGTTPALGAVEYIQGAVTEPTEPTDPDEGTEDPDVDVTPDYVTYTVTTNDVTSTEEGSLAYALMSVQDGDVIEFNFDGTTITQSTRTTLSKSITIDCMNLYNNQPITFDGTASLFSTASGTDITLKNFVLNGSLAEIAITCGGNKLTIENCSFINCNSSNDGGANNGGAIRNGSGDLVVTNCYFENCKSGGSYGGGAICYYKASSTNTITNSTFVDCAATAGGAIYTQAGLDLTITNSTFVNNAANIGEGDRRGGAIYFKGTAGTTNATIVNCTFTGNRALSAGGAICGFASSGYYINLTMVNDIFLYNYATSASYDIYAWNANDRVNATSSNCFYGVASDFFDATSTQYAVANDLGIFDADLALATATLDLDVLVPVLDSEKNVVKLAEYSPAIAAGTATFEGVEIPTTDQLGNERGTTPSVGAVEYYKETSSTINGDQCGSGIAVACNNGTLRIAGIDGVSTVTVYDLCGRVVCSQAVTVDSTIPMPTTGVYVVKVDNQVFKVANVK